MDEGKEWQHYNLRGQHWKTLEKIEVDGEMALLDLGDGWTLGHERDCITLDNDLGTFTEHAMTLARGTPGEWEVFAMADLSELRLKQSSHMARLFEELDGWSQAGYEHWVGMREYVGLVPPGQYLMLKVMEVFEDVRGSGHGRKLVEATYQHLVLPSKLRLLSLWDNPEGNPGNADIFRHCGWPALGKVEAR